MVMVVVVVEGNFLGGGELLGLHHLLYLVICVVTMMFDIGVVTGRDGSEKRIHV